jgi:tyrosinase
VLRLGASAGMAFAGGTLLGRAPSAQTTPSYRVRCDVNSENAAEAIETYRRGVAMMRSLPSSDPFSWRYQATVHRDSCPHGNWFFLPWHRAYLDSLEKIIQQLTGDSAFALPYWDWNRDPQLPAACTEPTWFNGSRTVANPLLDGTRVAKPGDTLSDELVGDAVMSNIMAQTSFPLFGSSKPKGQTDLASTWQRVKGTSGRLEATPHNGVHNWVGGNMKTMLSPLDPLFWLHHANCDRIWAAWNAGGGANPTASLWRNFPLWRFVGLDEQLREVLVRDVLDIQTLGYRYDRAVATQAWLGDATDGGFWLAAAPGGEAGWLRDGPTSPAFFRAAGRGRATLQRPLSLTVTVPDGALDRDGAQAVLVLGGIPGPDAAESPLLRVFIEDPTIGPDASPSGPNHVATFAFFGSDAQEVSMGAHAGHGAHGGNRFSFALDITPKLRELRRRGHRVGSRLNVQLVVAPLKGRSPPKQTEIAPAEVELAVF